MKVLGWRKKPDGSVLKSVGYRLLDAREEAPTFTSAGNNTYIECYQTPDGKIRRLHIDEMKTIMGFPASHIVSKGSDGYRQIGNAVMPPMITAIFDTIVA